MIRFYQKDHLGTVDTESISYLNSLPILQKIEQEKGSQSTSLFSQRQGKTSTDLFKAPSYQELHPESAETELTITIKDALPSWRSISFYKIYQVSDKLPHLFSISANMRDR